MNTDEPLYLHVEEKDGVFYVVDQHGRKVHGVRSLCLNAGIEEVTTATLDFACLGADGHPSVNRQTPER